MAGLPFTLTTAGLALANPANTGTNAIIIERIGVSAVAIPGAPEDNLGLLQLPNELKRLATFGGVGAGDDVVHVTVRDESADVYELRTFGLYSAEGVLLAFYSQPEPVMEKAASSMLLLAADLVFTTPIAAELVFGDTTFINPPATTVTPGVVELATSAETQAGTDATRAVTPFSLKSVLQGFAALAHTHDAADVVSGVLNVGRIPALAMSKITGLATELANKAAAVHGHAMADVAGLVQSLADLWAAVNGKAAAAHQHDASETVSGVFSVGRIPALAMEKITGLAAALAGKAAAVHGHDWSQVSGRPEWANPDDAAVIAGYKAFTGSERAIFNGDVDGGRAAAEIRAGGGGAAYLAFHRPDSFMAFLGVDVDNHWKVGGFSMGQIAYRIWHEGNFNPATKATWGEDASFRDITASRGNGQGVIYLGDPNHYLYWNGGAYELPNGALFVDGASVWTAATFNPVTKADASAWNDEAVDSTVSGYKQFVGLGVGPIATGYQTGSRAALEARGAGGAAYMAFHRPGQFATFLGIDTDNHLKIGGWSMGATAYRILHEENVDLWWPAGELKLFGQNDPPVSARVLVADGSAVSRSTYARLFAAIGATYGAGDGATTFNLPDWRGVFFRGLDRGRGLDPNRQLGAYQGSQNLSHTHSIPEGSAGSSTSGSFVGHVSGDDYTSQVVGYSTSLASGGTEARPVNQALLACISY